MVNPIKIEKISQTCGQLKIADFVNIYRKTAENKSKWLVFGCFFGRSGGTRTRGLQYPKLARYQLRYTSKW